MIEGCYLAMNNHKMKTTVRDLMSTLTHVWWHATYESNIECKHKQIQNKHIGLGYELIYKRSLVDLET